MIDQQRKPVVRVAYLAFDRLQRLAWLRPNLNRANKIDRTIRSSVGSIGPDHPPTVVKQHLA